MVDTAYLDVETRSACDLKSAGLYRYFEDETTEVLCVRFRIGDGPVLDDPMLLKAHIEVGGIVAGHNIAFDRTAWNTLDFVHLPIEQTDCTMARAAALSVPQALEGAGKALDAKVSKDMAGHRLMMRMCKPRKVEADGTLVWWESDEQLKALGDYCAQDVLSECELDRVLPPLSPSERKVWLLDQTINARGVQLDVPMVEKALAVAEVAAVKASAQMEQLTGGEVKRCTEAAKIVRWLNARGIVCESVAKGEVEDLLTLSDMTGDPVARQVVELRRAAAKSSVAKYRAMAKSVCRDGRVRGTLNYHGASTGRWAGRLIQPHNLPRILDAADDVILLHEILAQHSSAEAAYGHCAMLWENPLGLLSRALRSMLVAKEGHVLLGGDYSNIEGRVAAWIAGEDWKVEAFAAYDRGEGADLYELAYAKSFHMPVERVTKPQRQIGKVMELSMGYAGGVRAFQKMGANYGLVTTDDRAEELKLAWRDAHPNVVAAWYELQDAAVQAVQNQGMKVTALGGKIDYLVKHGILWCRLPSGRALSYPNPRIVWSEATPERKSRPQVEFEGVDSMTKKWGPHRLYGGLQFENIVQAVARDILVEGMFRLEEAGYPIVLTVHDENICEVAKNFGSPEELAALMSVIPTWTKGLPVAVSAWKDKRYVK